MLNDFPTKDSFEISAKFRQSIQDRIVRLERDADYDEAQIALLYNSDHIRRQKRMVAVERAEAMRMRAFLERSQGRDQKPSVAL